MSGVGKDSAKPGGPEGKSRPLTCGEKAVLAFIALVILVFAWMFIEARIITISEIKIESPDVPEAFDGFKIVHLSDIHHGPYFGTGFVERIVEKTNEQNPDLVLITGDYVHRSPKYIGPVFEVLAGLKAKTGIYSVLGNHDYWEGADEVREGMKKDGIADLENRAVWIEKGGQRIKIGGVGDLWEASQNLGPTLEGVNKKDFVILLSHNPDYVQEIHGDSLGKIDLMLCGHTHGGQVTLFGLYAPRLPIKSGQKFRSGRVDVDGMIVYVSRGLGTITPPIRFFCPPEIVVITLEKA